MSTSIDTVPAGSPGATMLTRTATKHQPGPTPGIEIFTSSHLNPGFPAAGRTI